eukprot:12107182-Ditylum_brightwellii.AAC.2
MTWSCPVPPPPTEIQNVVKVEEVEETVSQMVETVSSKLEQSQVVPPTSKSTQSRSISAERNGVDSWVLLNGTQEDKESFQMEENKISPTMTAGHKPTAIVEENVSTREKKGWINSTKL